MHAIQRLRKKDPELRAALARRPGAIDWAAFDSLETLRARLAKAWDGKAAREARLAAKTTA